MWAEVWEPDVTDKRTFTLAGYVNPEGEFVGVEHAYAYQDPPRTRAEAWDHLRDLVMRGGVVFP